MTVPSSSVAFSSTGQWSRKRLLVSPEPTSGAGGLDIRIYPSAVIGATSNAGIGVAIVIFLILWFAIIIGSLVMMIVALVDIVRRPDWQWKMAGQEKVLWLLLVILVNFLAIPSLIYWFNIRKKLKTVEDRAASGHYGPGHMTYSGWEPVPFPVPISNPGMAPAGWYPDASGQNHLRWWDGARWTDHTSDGFSPT